MQSMIVYLIDLRNRTWDSYTEWACDRERRNQSAIVLNKYSGNFIQSFQLFIID